MFFSHVSLRHDVCHSNSRVTGMPGKHVQIFNYLLPAEGKARAGGLYLWLVLTEVAFMGH